MSPFLVHAQKACAAKCEHVHVCLFTHAETHSLVSHQTQASKEQLTGKAARGWCFRSSVYFSEHNILGTYDGHDICQHVSLRHLVQTSQVGKTGSLDLTPIRAAAAIGYQVYPKLSLRSFNGSICGSWRNLVALCIQLKVMN